MKFTEHDRVTRDTYLLKYKQVYFVKIDIFHAWSHN